MKLSKMRAVTDVIEKSDDGAGGTTYTWVGDDKFAFLSAPEFWGQEIFQLGDLTLRRVGVPMGDTSKYHLVVVMRDGIEARLRAAFRRFIQGFYMNKILPLEVRLLGMQDGGLMPKYSLSNLTLRFNAFR